MSEKSLGAALLNGKCPACREGNIFRYPLRRISHFAEMNPRCPVCNSGFEPEPGFYFGAMYITYAVNVALLVGFGLSLFYFTRLSETVSLLFIAILAAALTPPSFRYSRILWLHWFGGLRYQSRDRD